jgi:DNA gyrase subunit A
MVMTAEGKILRTRVDDVREIGRNAQGVRLIDMTETDRVVGVAKLAESSVEGAGEGSGAGSNGDEPGPATGNNGG